MFHVSCFNLKLAATYLAARLGQVRCEGQIVGVLAMARSQNLTAIQEREHETARAALTTSESGRARRGWPASGRFGCAALVTCGTEIPGAVGVLAGTD